MTGGHRAPGGARTKPGVAAIGGGSTAVWECRRSAPLCVHAHCSLKVQMFALRRSGICNQTCYFAASCLNVLLCFVGGTWFEMNHL